MKKFGKGTGRVRSNKAARNFWLVEQLDAVLVPSKVIKKHKSRILGKWDDYANFKTSHVRRLKHRIKTSETARKFTFTREGVPGEFKCLDYGKQGSSNRNPNTWPAGEMVLTAAQGLAPDANVEDALPEEPSVQEAIDVVREHAPDWKDLDFEMLMMVMVMQQYGWPIEEIRAAGARQVQKLFFGVIAEMQEHANKVERGTIHWRDHVLLPYMVDDDDPARFELTPEVRKRVRTRVKHDDHARDAKGGDGGDFADILDELHGDDDDGSEESGDDIAHSGATSSGVSEAKDGEADEDEDQPPSATKRSRGRREDQSAKPASRGKRRRN